MTRKDRFSFGVIALQHNNLTKEGVVWMKHGKPEVQWRVRALPEVRFEDQQPTSFAGLVVFRPLFEHLGLENRLREYFEHLKVNPTFGDASMVMLLIVHLLTGYRRLSGLHFYQDDPMVQRMLPLERLPDVATVSRTRGGMDNVVLKALRT